MVLTSVHMRKGLCIQLRLFVCACVFMWVWPKNVCLHTYRPNVFAKRMSSKLLCSQRCFARSIKSYTESAIPLFLFIWLSTGGLLEFLKMKSLNTLYNLEIVTSTVWFAGKADLYMMAVHWNCCNELSVQHSPLTVLMQCTQYVAIRVYKLKGLILAILCGCTAQSNSLHTHMQFLAANASPCEQSLLL